MTMSSNDGGTPYKRMFRSSRMPMLQALITSLPRGITVRPSRNPADGPNYYAMEATPNTAGMRRTVDAFVAANHEGE